MKKLDLVEKLHNGTVSLVFVKKDGTERPMIATLNERLIPEDKQPKGTGKPLSEESTIVRAYDLEMEAYRSINAETTTIIEATTL